MEVDCKSTRLTPAARCSEHSRRCIARMAEWYATRAAEHAVSNAAQGPCNPKTKDVRPLVIERVEPVAAHPRSRLCRCQAAAACSKRLRAARYSCLRAEGAAEGPWLRTRRRTRQSECGRRDLLYAQKIHDEFVAWHLRWPEASRRHSNVQKAQSSLSHELPRQSHAFWTAT
eukprot:6644877-Prymnesium_polylepis.2